MADKLVKYQHMPVWYTDTLPKSFREKHNTKIGTWGKLTIVKGRLEYSSLDESGTVLSSHIFSQEDQPPFIEPQQWHKVEPASDDLECYLEFYCLPEQYFEKKYRLSAPHSEVKEVLQFIKGGTALDLGCGRGRNSLFLHQNGFDVTAVDISETSIQKLNDIIASEDKQGGITAHTYNAEAAAIQDEYDLIVSTVVLQFLDAKCIKAVIDNVQEKTKVDGVNLIVAPISSPEMPCPIDLPFTFAPGELKNLYKDWSILKYNEDIGEFHRTDEQGNRYKAKFATIIARKIAS